MRMNKSKLIYIGSAISIIAILIIYFWNGSKGRDNIDKINYADSILSLCQRYQETDLIRMHEEAHKAFKIGTEIESVHIQSKANLYLSIYEWTKNNRDSALNMAFQVLVETKKHGDKHLEAKCYNILGRFYFDYGNMMIAKDYYYQALRLNQDLKYQYGIATNLLNIGKAESKLGNEAKAMKNYIKSFEIYQKINDKNGMSLVKLNQANSYQKSQLFLKARDIYFECFNYYSSVKDSSKMASCLHNIGSSYTSEGEFDLAIDYLNQSIKISKLINDQQGEIESLSNIAGIEGHLGNLKLANQINTAVLNYYRDNKDSVGIALALMSIFTLQDLGNIESEEFLEAEQIFQKLELKYELIDLYTTAKNKSIKNQNHLQALAYQDRISFLENQLYGTEKQNSMELIFANHKKETQLNRQLELLNLQKAENDKLVMAIWIVSLSAIFIIVALLIAFYLYYNYKRVNKLLEVNDDLILRINEQLTKDLAEDLYLLTIDINQIRKKENADSLTKNFSNFLMKYNNLQKTIVQN